jgi:hypothetical protein
MASERGPVRFFDRGPGYATLDPEGRAFPELDVVEVH